MKQFGLSENTQFATLARGARQKREEDTRQADRLLADRIARNAAAEIAGMIERCEWMRDRALLLRARSPEMNRIHALLEVALEDLQKALTATVEQQP